MFRICSHINMSNEDEPDQPPQYDPMDVCPRNTRRHDALDPPPRPVSEDHLAFMEGEAQRIAAHDFSAGDFDWVPVPRRRHNADGWTVARQQAFIRLLADTGSVDRAAFQVGMRRTAAIACAASRGRRASPAPGPRRSRRRPIG